MAVKRHLRGRLLLVALTPAVALLAAPMSAGATGFNSGPMLHGNSARASPNWSGYAATGGTFSSVSASWVQPAGKCGSSESAAGFWVGLDGYSDGSVEQTGTAVVCSGGSVQYFGWYEMYPKNSVTFSNTVESGDHFTGSVTASGRSFVITLTDVTQKWTHKETETSDASRSSAEVIAEAPCCTGGGGIVPLTRFGTAAFTTAKVDGSAIGATNPVEITMVSPSTGRVEAKPSALTAGKNFKVTWRSS